MLLGLFAARFASTSGNSCAAAYPHRIGDVMVAIRICLAENSLVERGAFALRVAVYFVAVFGGCGLYWVRIALTSSSFRFLSAPHWAIKYISQPMCLRATS